MSEKLIPSAHACLENGRRLLLDAEYLEFGEPPTTSLFLCSIAQEEIAKGFLLALVVRGVLPWDQRLLRAARDHSCKQLIGLVVEYISPDTDEFLDRCNAVVLRNEIVSVPQRVVDAIHILRYEKVGRWLSHEWMWDHERAYDGVAAAVADGKLDKLKQDTIYVRLARDGGVASVPGGATYENVRAARDRSERMMRVAHSVLAGEEYPAIDYDKVETIFRELFRTLPEDHSAV